MALVMGELKLISAPKSGRNYENLSVGDRASAGSEAFWRVARPASVSRRGRRPKKDARRYPSGQLIPEIGNGYLLSQRIGRIDVNARLSMLRILAIPIELRTQEQHTILQSLSRAAARNPNLSYPTGIAFARGYLTWKDAKYNEHAGDELKWAADHYAALHRQVWGPLPKLVEEAMTAQFGRDAFQMLLQVGRVKNPPPISTIFKNLVGEDPSPVSDLDPEEIRKRRWRSQSRFWEARKELANIGALKIVDDTVIDGIDPLFLNYDTPQSFIQRELFRKGLYVLAKKFGLIEE